LLKSVVVYVLVILCLHLISGLQTWFTRALTGIIINGIITAQNNKTVRDHPVFKQNYGIEAARQGRFIDGA
jgi:hypothetical protein